MAQDDKPTLVQRPAGYGKLVPKGYKNVAKDKVYKKLEDITKTDVATFIAEMTPVIGDAIAAKEVYDEIQKDDPNWLLIGALGGATIIGVVPFVGDAASKLIKKGARQALDVAKRIEVDTNALGSLGGNIRIKAAQEVVEDFVPQKTVKAYKLFKTDPKKPGELFPLFVDANTPVSQGVWSKAKAGELGDSGKVKSKIGPLAYRPGWHAGDLPVATHIGGKVDPTTGKRVADRKFAPNIRENNQVWAEVEMPADVDWQAVADARAKITKKGTPDPKTAHITDQLPSGGHYRYKTNSNMTGNWLISGEMKVNRVLDRSEVNAINEAAGVKDLPTLSELNKGYSKGGTVMDDYQYAEMMSNGYAVGGAVEKQTRMAFADGGLPVDPVSGNEVPPGSLPEEVRDDIPARLSEGEYIVPADVLRYYGMKFFEDLRIEAKVALSGMEQNGRMGGDPIMKAPMEEDDLPFLTEELQATDGMNEGGYIRGYAPGGLGVSQKTGKDYSEGTQMANIFGTTTSGIQLVPYYGPTGEIIKIMTYNGSPMQAVPVGYTRTPPVAAAGDVAPPTDPSNNSNNSNNDDNGSDKEPRKTAEEQAAELASRFDGTDWGNLSSDIMKNISGLDKDAEGWKALIPGFSFVQKLNRVSEVGIINAKIKVLELQGDAAGAKAAKAALEAQMKAAGINILTGLGTGTQYFGGITRLDSGFIDPLTGLPRSNTNTVIKPTVKAIVKDIITEQVAEQVEPFVIKQLTNAPAAPTVTTNFNNMSDDDQSDRQQNTSDTFEAAKVVAESNQSENAKKGNLSSGVSNKDSTTVTDERKATESADYGALNKGGLMTKKKKKK